jgi:Nif-specific regulatory protein
VLLAETDRIDESAVEYALVTEAQGQPVDVLRRPQPSTPVATATPTSAVREWRPVSGSEGDNIRAALAGAHGNKSRAAQTLGLTLRQLNYRINKLRLG